MEQYNVTGMSCAACSARVEKAVKKVPGVTSCSVSLLTNSMGVEGTASSAAIIQAVQEAGYGASPKTAGAAAASSPSADLDALAEVIRRQNPDFVTLNEVDAFTNRTGKDVHQARDLAAKLGMEWHFSKAIDRDGGEYGDAVLSKYPILEKRSYRLPCAAEQPGEDRSLCVIRVQIDGKDLYVASTHLDHLSGDASRMVQANEIRRIRDTELEGDLILCGDLNAIPSSNVIATMTSFLTNTGPIDQYTFPSDDPSRKIDYIMYAPIEHFGVQNCQVVSRGDQQVGGVDASDHRPVIADIRFQTEEDISGEDGGGEE